MPAKFTDASTVYGKFQSDADHSASAYLACGVAATGLDVDVATANAQTVVGVFGPDVADYSSLPTGAYGSPEVIIGGAAGITLGGTINAGVYVTPTTAGKFIAATTGQYAIALTLENGVDGDVVPAIIERLLVP